MIAEVFGVLHRRGEREAVCEVDRTDIASNSLMTLLGARRAGGTLELVRRAAVAPLSNA